METVGWKKEKPVRNGYFWVLKKESDTPKLVQIQGLTVYYMGNDTPYFIETKKEYRESGFYGSYWLGPLTIPEKPPKDNPSGQPRLSR